MNIQKTKLIWKYSTRIFTRNFFNFLLPLITIVFTTMVVATSLLVTRGSESYVLSKNRELVGGDIQIEASRPIAVQDIEAILQVPVANNSSITSTKGLSFSSLIQYKDTARSVSVSVLDASYPLYGSILLQKGEYLYPKKDEVYIDEALARGLAIQTGDTLTLNSVPYTVVGIVTASPDRILSGFSFFPTIRISQEGFTRSLFDPALLRSEYRVSLAGIQLPKSTLSSIEQKAAAIGLDIDFAAEPRGGVIRGIGAVNKFVIIAVIISCVLASVNIYAGVLFLVKRLRKSLAILSAVGLDKKSLAYIMAGALVYTLAIAVSLGLGASVYVYQYMQAYVADIYNVALPTVPLAPVFFVTAVLVLLASLASFIPNIQAILRVNPKILLNGGEDIGTTKTKKELVVTTVLSFLPLLGITIYLLESFVAGFLSVLGIVVVYLLLAAIFFVLLLFLYKKRAQLGFLFRSIVSIKYKDGIFGIVSVTSLYVALASIATLILLQTTLYSFLTTDIRNTIPSMYVIDVQKSQLEGIVSTAPQIQLFPNIGARIVAIDDVSIQEELAKENTTMSQELAREFNLSHVVALSDRDIVVKGTPLSGIPNEVSIDAEFASRANIRLGSQILFNIQGFDLLATVTSIRETNRNSGLPFFYFLFNTKDLTTYPATYFGYGYFDDAQIASLSKVLADTYPNVSIINTKDASAIVFTIVRTLSLLVLVIAIPPLILSIFLVSTLIMLSFSSKRKLRAQLMALGSSNRFIRMLFYIESSFFTILASIVAYGTAVAVTIVVARKYLDIDTYTLYSHELLATFGAIIGLILVITFALSVFDRRSIRELLSYEEN